MSLDCRIDERTEAAASSADDHIAALLSGLRLPRLEQSLRPLRPPLRNQSQLRDRSRWIGRTSGAALRRAVGPSAIAGESGDLQAPLLTPASLRRTRLHD